MAKKIRTRTTPEEMRRRALVVVALVVPAVLGVVALPKYFSLGDAFVDREPPLEEDVVGGEPTPPPAPEAEEPPPEPVVDTDAPHAGGDLRIALALRRASVPSGRPVKARITLRNLSLGPLHVPAPGEPQTTLRILVVDENGEAVRDVVETAADPMPRRTRCVDAGGEVAWDVDVVAPGEKPLPPGAYRIAAVYDAAPAWRRTGLPMWRAPSGALRAEQVRLEITPRQ